MSRAELKEKAKKSLQGKYGQAIIMNIIFGLLTSVFGAVTLSKESTNVVLQLVVSLAAVVVTALLTLGSTSFYMKVARNEEVTYKELFSKTSLWLIYIGVTLVSTIFIGLWTLLLIIPGIIASYSYSMINYIMVDNPNIGVLECIKRSKEMMNGHKWELFVLRLSFIGWIFLGIFTLGILYFWLIPYMNVTMANFYDSVKELKQN